MIEIDPNQPLADGGRSMAFVNIIPLAERPAAIQTLARWFHGEWQGFDGRAIETIQAQLVENLNRDRVPITFLACDSTGLLGTASLDCSDLPGFDHLSPWLSSLYVALGARSHGIGSALVRHVQHFAFSRGFNEIYLWSPGATRFYDRFGWTAIDTALCNAQRITIMRFRCETNA